MALCKHVANESRAETTRGPPAISRPPLRATTASTRATAYEIGEVAASLRARAAASVGVARASSDWRTTSAYNNGNFVRTHKVK
jgi:hypothetical protein